MLRGKGTYPLPKLLKNIQDMRINFEQYYAKNVTDSVHDRLQVTIGHKYKITRFQAQERIKFGHI